MKAFISYSHKDELYLEKLRIALAQIRRQGLLHEWTDHEIQAGSRLNEAIDQELFLSQLFIALLSPDYLASNYCYEKEFKQAEQLEAENKMKILPIICRPCDWKNTSFIRFKALPKDGKAISEWQNEDSAFFNITEMLRLFIQQPIDANRSVGNTGKTSDRKFQGSYKVRKDFDIVQKSNFIDKTFEEVKNFFKDYLDELASSENVTYKILNNTNKTFRCFLVNRDMGIAQCECLFKKNEDGVSPHYFNFNEGDLNAIFVKENREEAMGFTLNNDEYEMFFSSRNISFGGGAEKRLDSKSIANQVWKKWLTQIGIDIL